jgi:tripartite-type tricarboxylate transporter receptor subunit TctC
MWTRLFSCLLGIMLVAAQASGQEYPTRKVRVLEPLATGSAVDVVTRLIADKIGQDLGQTFYVDNQPGAAGLIGMRTGAKSAPDGYTVLAVNDAILTVLPNAREDAGYDPVKDFEPVSLLAKLRWVLVAHESFPANNVQELIALAKQKPGSIDYGSGGPGSPQHVAMELFMRDAGVKLNHIPYRGVTQALTDLVSGHIPVMFIALPAPLAFVPTKQVKILGFTEGQRHPGLPDVPTIAEQGMPGFEFISYAAWLVPAGTPKPVIDKLSGSIKKAMADEAIKKQITEFGSEPVGSSPEDLRRLIEADLVVKAKLIKDANIRLE